MGKKKEQPPTLNEEIADQDVVDALQVERVKTGEVNAALREIDLLSAALVAELVRVNISGRGVITREERKAVRLFQSSDKRINSAYADIRRIHSQVMAGMSVEAQRQVLASVNDVVGIPLAAKVMTKEQLRVLARDTLVEGAKSAEWWSRQAANTRSRFKDVVRDGIRSGQTNQQIVQRVRGTRRAGFNDGIMSASRREAESLVRTSVQTVLNEARAEAAQENQAVVKAVQQRSTLDSRTTHICMAYSGLQWSLPDYEPIGHDLPYLRGPPRHWGCRSTIVWVTKSWEELLGAKIPTESGGTSQGVDNHFERELKNQGLKASEIARVKANARASMDGQVARDFTFEEWLRTKTPAFQQEILGPGRFELWKKGRISLRDLVNSREKALTLDQLRQRAAS